MNSVSALHLRKRAIAQNGIPEGRSELIRASAPKSRTSSSTKRKGPAGPSGCASRSLASSQTEKRFADNSTPTIPAFKAARREPRCARDSSRDSLGAGSGPREKRPRRHSPEASNLRKTPLPVFLNSTDLLRSVNASGAPKRGPLAV